MPVVVIAEKPSVATDIAKVLGVSKKKETHWESDEVWITWAVGHLLELKTLKNTMNHSRTGENQSTNFHSFLKTSNLNQ